MKNFFIHWHDQSEILITVRNKKLIEIVGNRTGLRDLGKLLIEYSKSDGENDFHIYPRTEGYYNGMLDPNSLDLSVVLKK